MRFGFSNEQDQFRAGVRRFLERHSSTAEVRRLMATAEGFDRSVWRQIVRELELTALHVPEAYGGAGFGFEEVGIAAEEMGRSLCCAPYFSSAVLATHALLDGASEAVKCALLPAIASGETLAALAATEAAARFDPQAIALTATPRNGAHVLDGLNTFVIDGHVADVIIVAARAPGSTGDAGITLFQVPGNAPGLHRRLLDTLDTTRKQAELRFDGVRAEPVGDAGAGAAVLAKTFDRAAVALACEMVGGARALLDACVEYAKLRVQFGRPIGSFQAIKHRLADLLLEIELARSAAHHAAAAVAEDDPQVPALASLAKATASDAYMHMAAESIQIHGGIGFTWDHDAHLWFRRAKSSEVLLGDPAWHRERYLRLVA